METVPLKKERWIPPSVIRAKMQAALTGNNDELVRLSQLGNQAKRERNAWRKDQGVLPLKVKRQKRCVSRESQQPLTPEQKKELCADSRLINWARREELAAIALQDAEEHARLNRIGWCDDPTGWYDYLADSNDYPIHSGEQEE